MKNLILTLSFCLFAVICPAQKVSFTESTNNWTVFSYACGGDPNYVERFNYHCGATVVINDTSYLEIFRDTYLAGYIREDKPGNKIYFKAAIPTYYYPDTIYTEQLLYDYSLHVGDTFYALRTRHHVAAIDTVNISGIVHKVWHMAADTSWLPYGHTIEYDVVEGIGSLLGPLNPLMCSFFENCIQLTCFSTNYTSPALSRGVGYRGYFNNSTSCNLTFGLLVTGFNQATSLQLYPNPATMELNLQAREALKQIQITDPVGRTVYSAYRNETQAIIDIASLSNGLYFVVINGVVLGKFIKQ